jgi:hypothetical protein
MFVAAEEDAVAEALTAFVSNRPHRIIIIIFVNDEDAGGVEFDRRLPPTRRRAAKRGERGAAMRMLTMALLLLFFRATTPLLTFESCAGDKTLERGSCSLLLTVPFSSAFVPDAKPMNRLCPRRCEYLRRDCYRSRTADSRHNQHEPQEG